MGEPGDDLPSEQLGSPHLAIIRRHLAALDLECTELSLEEYREVLLELAVEAATLRQMVLLTRRGK